MRRIRLAMLFLVKVWKKVVLGAGPLSLQTLKEQAVQGDADAQNNLGAIYGNGEGVRQDHAEAVKWYQLAAEQGHADAQNNLGVMYTNGEGVRQDYAKAVKWYRLAAEQGHAYAQNNLGIMYDNGRGVRQDHAKAVKWYRLAAAQGHAEAQTYLGEMYDNRENKPTVEGYTSSLGDSSRPSSNPGENKPTVEGTPANDRNAGKPISSVQGGDVWFVLAHGKKKEGPFTLERLRARLQGVSARSQLRIRKGTTGEWCPWVNAGAVFPELATASVKSAAEADTTAHSERAGSTPVRIDLRGDAERRVEEHAQRSLDAADERLAEEAHYLVVFLQSLVMVGISQGQVRRLERYRATVAAHLRSQLESDIAKWRANEVEAQSRLTATKEFFRSIGHKASTDEAEARRRLREIGEELGKNGGDQRMRLVAYRVQALGSSTRDLDYAWRDICGWQI